MCNSANKINEACEKIVNCTKHKSGYGYANSSINELLNKKIETGKGKEKEKTIYEYNRELSYLPEVNENEKASINYLLENLLISKLSSIGLDTTNEINPEFIKHKNIHHVSINTSIETMLEADEKKPKHVDLAFKREKQIVVIEVKKIYTNTEGSDYPYLFSRDDDQNKLLSTNFYDLGKSMLLNHRGFEIITHYQEGQIVHDIMRLLNFKHDNRHVERYIVCFVQNNSSKNIIKPTIKKGETLVERLETVLKVAQEHFKYPVFTDGYGRTFSQLQDGPGDCYKFDNPVYALRTPKPGMSFTYEFSKFGSDEFCAGTISNSKREPEFMACVIKITPDPPPRKRKPRRRLF